jgi:hypothetical protein
MLQQGELVKKIPIFGRRDPINKGHRRVQKWKKLEDGRIKPG